MSSAPADYYDDSYDDGYLEPDGNSTIDCSLCLNELCLNADDYELYRSWVSVDTYEMVFISLITVVFLTGIIGNTLVIMAVSSTKSMQSVTNIFIVNLAVADILVMLFCAPPSIIWDVTNTWIFGSAMCRIVIFIQDLSVSVSVLTLTFIAYDRYHAICKPLQFSSQKSKALLVIGAIWSISATIGIPDAVTLQLDSPFAKAPCRAEDILFDLSSCSPTWSEEFDFFFILLKAFLLYTIPLIFMTVAYYHIVRTLWRRHHIPGSSQEHRQHDYGNGGNLSLLARSATVRSSRSDGGASSAISAATSTSGGLVRATTNSTANPAGSGGLSSNRTLDNQLRTRRKVAKMLIAVVCMFSINFFPVHLVPIVNCIVDLMYTRDSPEHERISQVLVYGGIITHCMCYFNSAINPIIYYFMSAQFKAQYRRLLSCRWSADTRSPVTNRTLLNHHAADPSNGEHHKAAVAAAAARQRAAAAAAAAAAVAAASAGGGAPANATYGGGTSRFRGMTSKSATAADNNGSSVRGIFKQSPPMKNGRDMMISDC